MTSKLTFSIFFGAVLLGLALAVVLVEVRNGRGCPTVAASFTGRRPAVVGTNATAVPLAGVPTKLLCVSDEQGQLVVKRSGAYDVTLWAACKLAPNRCGAEATVRLSFGTAEWFQTLLRHQGGPHYSNMVALGVVQVSAGQTLTLECVRVDGVAEVTLEHVVLRVAEQRAHRHLPHPRSYNPAEPGAGYPTTDRQYE
jgi:hypothetical protein